MKSVTYVSYDTDGNITAVFSGSTATLSEPDGTFIEYEGSELIRPRTHFVLAGMITTKTALTATWDVSATMSINADGVDEAVLATLPNPCTVYVDGDPVAVTDGSFEFAAKDPGVYRVSVDEPAFLRQEWEIEAS